MSEAREIFIENLKRIMGSKHITQTDIAEKMNKPLSTVSSWYNGQSYPRVDSMQKLADILDVSMRDLTDNQGNIMEEYYNSNATPQQKQNLQSQTLDRIKNYFDEDAYNLFMNYLNCDAKGKEWLNERSNEAVKLYPKDNN